MFDFDVLVRIAKAQGKGHEAFAADLGIDPGHLWRLKKGRSKPTALLIEKACAILHVSPTLLGLQERSEWLRFHRSRLDLLTEFHDDFQQSERVLAVVTSAESYLQDEWMLDWSNRVWLGIRNWGDHQRTLFPYARQQVVARHRSNFVHRIVCPWELFVAARHQSIDWLDNIRHGLGAFNEITAVMPVRNWQRVYDECSKHLSPDSIGWNKLSIVDSRRALIHVAQERYLMCATEAVIRPLKAAIESILARECQSFLQESQITVSSVRDAAHQMEDDIESLLTTKDDQLQLQANAQAFARMIVEGVHVPPRRFLPQPPQVTAPRRPLSDHLLRRMAAVDRFLEESAAP